MLSRAGGLAALLRSLGLQLSNSFVRYTYIFENEITTIETMCFYTTK